MTAIQEENNAHVDVAGLVRDAAAGDRGAWERLIAQYGRLIWAITREYKLVESDAADVAQVTWLRLLEHIHQLRSPDRVGSWLAATARNECLRVLAARKRVVLGHDETALEGTATATDIDERLLAAERADMVRQAMSRLPSRWQQLLTLLMADPPVSYAEISAKLGLPIGSIGPTRSRCLARLRELLHQSVTDDQMWELRLRPLPQLGGSDQSAGGSGDLQHPRWMTRALNKAPHS